MKKIALLCLALVLALGGLGIGYAAWTDTVTIDGTVNTGTVDIVVDSYSGMWMWKVPGDVPDYVLSTDPEFVPEQIPEEDAPFIVAFASAAQAVDDVGAPVDDAITVTFDNLFPLNGGADDWEADFVLHYVGSVPVKVDIADITFDPEVLGDLGITITAYEMTGENHDVPVLIGDEEDLLGKQLEYCDYIKIIIGINVPQYEDEAMNEVNMGLSGSITGTIHVIQWNEYVAAP